MYFGIPIMISLARSTLSPLEQSILKRIALEQSANDIARELGLSLLEVHEYRQQIMRKTKSRSLIGLLKAAIRQGLLEEYSYQNPQPK